MSEPWRDINDPGPIFKPEPADNTRVVYKTDPVETPKKEPPPIEVKLSEGKFLPPDGDLTFNDKCKVQVKVEYLRETSLKRITFCLFCAYNGKTEQMKPDKEGFENNGVAEAEFTLFYPENYKEGDKADFYFKASHRRGEKIIDSEKLTMPMSSGKVIKNGDNGTIVEEINVRLSGFGGGVPSDQFDAITETKVKNFQKEYMEMEKPTGEVDEETAKKIDEFAGKYSIDLNSLKCTCHKCDGFGKGRHKNEYFEKKDKNGKQKPHTEATHRYEYPGMHRFLLWAFRGLNFHLTKETTVSAKIHHFSSGYRCNDHSLTIQRQTVNHMGKAVDVHFSTKANGSWIVPNVDQENNALCKKIRKVCTKPDVLNAQMEWGLPDRFSLESTVDGAKTWVMPMYECLKANIWMIDSFAKAFRK